MAVREQTQVLAAPLLMRQGRARLRQGVEESGPRVSSPCAYTEHPTPNQLCWLPGTACDTVAHSWPGEK